MQKERNLRERTMAFAVAVLRFCRTMPDDAEGRHLDRPHLLGRDGAAKLGTVIEEADESEFWLDLAVRANITDAGSARALRSEANELVAIFTQSQKTARSNGEH